MTLFEAIEAGDVAQTRSILADDPSLAGSRSPTGVSAVLWARYRGHQDVVDALLAADPDLDVFDAAGLGLIDRLTDLVDNDPGQANAWSPDGFAPLGLAAFFGHPEAVRYLIGRGADVHAAARNAMRVQPLHSAVAAGNVEAVRLLLEAGADPDAEQHGGWTPLMAARTRGDEDIIGLLLAHGAHEAPPPTAAPEDAVPEDTQTPDTGNRPSTS